MLTTEQNLWPLACRLIVAMLVGGLVGIERELHGRPAGLRTHILVCLGACLVALVDSLLPASREGQISPAIMTGIGFLGAGTILRSDKGDIHGLTSAASVWSTAALGLGVGYGGRAEGLACFAAVIVLLTLTLVSRFEAYALHQRRTGDLVLVLRSATEPQAAAQTEDVIRRLTDRGVKIAGALSQKLDEQSQNKVIRLHLRLPRGTTGDDLASDLVNNPNILQFDWDA